MREFIGIDLGRQNVPDATTLLKLRRLLGQHDLTATVLAEVNAHLSERGLLKSGALPKHPAYRSISFGLQIACA